MSHDGSPRSTAEKRSRSPPGGKAKPSQTPTGADGSADDPETWSAKLDVKLDGFKDDVKKVVNSLVGKQIERLEKD